MTLPRLKSSLQIDTFFGTAPPLATDRPIGSRLAILPITSQVAILRYEHNIASSTQTPPRNPDRKSWGHRKHVHIVGSRCNRLRAELQHQS
jgi:hypothetical protein